MPRETFERDLRRLQDEMVALGSLVSKALIESVETEISIYRQYAAFYSNVFYLMRRR